MNDKRAGIPDGSRRDFLRHAGLAAAALGAARGSEAFAQSGASPSIAPQPQSRAPSEPYNILFILSDQERFFRPGELPPGYRLPGHERLMQRGVSFTNHRINSCVCTSSRSVIYTGRHIQQTRMFDNTNFPWISSMSTELPTVGDLLREAGYYTAYKGKWHLTKEFETVNTLGSPTKIFTAEMEAYGFSDYLGVGDIIAHNRGGYLHDGVISAMGAAGCVARAGISRPPETLVPGGQPGKPARCDVLRHRCARQPLAAACRAGRRCSAIRSIRYMRNSGISGFPKVMGNRSTRRAGRRRTREFLRSHDALVGPIAGRGAALDAAAQLLLELSARFRPQSRNDFG